MMVIKYLSQNAKSFKALIYFNVIAVACSLSCPDYKHENTKLSLEVLKTMGRDDITECISFFGKEPVGELEGKYIWNSLVKFWVTVEDVPDNDIKQLGWILQHVPPADVLNFTLTEVDTIAALGQYHNLSEVQLQALGQRVLEDWAGKEPSDYTHYDLASLQHILCGFNTSTIELIHPDSYKEAAAALATLKGCPAEQMEALAGLAISLEAFGPPTEWTSSQVKNVGCVINGLSYTLIAAIPPSGVETVTPDIVPCILPDTIKAMTNTQLSHLTPSAVAALTPQQQAVFNKNQQKAVAEAYEGEKVKKSTGHKLLVKRTFLIVISLAVFIVGDSFNIFKGD